MSISRWIVAITLSVLLVFTATALVTEQDVATLPIQGLKAIQQEGEVVFMSDNGRFVIKGELYDLWTRQRVTDFQAMQRLSQRLDLKKMKLDIEALNTVTMGSDANAVVIFINPHCPDCKALIQAAKPLTNAYRFHWVLLPDSDPKTVKQIQNIVGAVSPEQALAAVVDNSQAALPTVSPGDPQKTALTQLTAQLMSIDKFPFLIAPDGRVHRGAPKNLKTWLEATS